LEEFFYRISCGGAQFYKINNLRDLPQVKPEYCGNTALHCVTFFEK
jgi:hypothetical protein